MYNQRVKVVGGVKERHEEGDGSNKKVWNSFTIKRSIVIEQQNLASLFRRDDYLCSLTCRIEDTREPLTPGYFFSEW